MNEQILIDALQTIDVYDDVADPPFTSKQFGDIARKALSEYVKVNQVTQPVPTCGARWVRASERMPDDPKSVTWRETKSKVGIRFGTALSTIHDYDPATVEWSYESPCAFPTRDEAIDWVINRYGPGPVDVRVKLACISFFDWLVGQCGKGSVDLVEIAFRRGHQLGYQANQIGESNYENACWEAFKSDHSL